MKKILICLFAFGLCVGFSTGCKDANDDAEKTEVVDENAIVSNDNAGVIKSQTIGDFEISMASIIKKDNQSEFSVMIKNNDTEDVYVEMFSAICKDIDGNEIISLPFYVGKEIKAGKKELVVTKTNFDLMDVVDIEYEIN